MTMILLEDLLRVLAYIEDERHLAAYELYQKVLLRLDESRKTRNNPPTDDQLLLGEDVDIEMYAVAHRFLEDKQDVFDALITRAEEFLRARDNMVVDEDWTLAQVMFGITTYYRIESDGTLSIRLEGDLIGVSLFEQLCVIREVDLYTEWAPFCSKAEKLMQKGKIEIIAYHAFSIPFLGLSRDIVFHAMGCDCMKEDGSILITAKSINQNEYPNIQLPSEPKGLGAARMFVRNFQSKIDVLGPSHARTRLVANIDPKVFLPQWLINFVMKKMAGLLLVLMQKMAKKVAENPDNLHGKRIRDEIDFYGNWVWPKFSSYCKELGWTVPEIKALKDFVSRKEHQQVEKNLSLKSSVTRKKEKTMKTLRRLNKVVFNVTNRKKKKVKEQSNTNTLSSNSMTLSPNDEARYDRLMEKRHALAKEKSRANKEAAEKEKHSVLHHHISSLWTTATLLPSMFLIFYGTNTPELGNIRGTADKPNHFFAFFLYIAAYLVLHCCVIHAAIVSCHHIFVPSIGPDLSKWSRSSIWIAIFISMVMLVWSLISFYHKSAFNADLDLLIKDNFSYSATFCTLFAAFARFFTRHDEI